MPEKLMDFLKEFFAFHKFITEPLTPVMGSWIDGFPLLVVFFVLLSAVFLMVKYPGKNLEVFRYFCRIAAFFVFVFFLFKCLCVVKLATFGLSELGKDDLISFGFLYLLALVGGFTFFSGRIYCGWLCPLGLIQEVAGMLSPMKSRKVRTGFLIFTIIISILMIYETFPANEFVYEFVIAILTFFLLLMLLLSYLKPELDRYLMMFKFPVLVIYIVINVFSIYYSEVWCALFGAEIDYSSIISLPMVFMASLAAGMPWCRYLCPTGTFLALCSRYSFIQLRGGCRPGCEKKCEEVCLFGALKKGKIDPLLCQRCGRCLSRCNSKVTFGTDRKS